MWVEIVVGSLLCSERFFSGYSGFPLSSKTNTSEFQFHLETVDEEPPRGNATANPIIIIIIIIIIIFIFIIIIIIIIIIIWFLAELIYAGIDQCLRIAQL